MYFFLLCALSWTCVLPPPRAGAQPAIPDASSWLPLHYATDRGHIDCVSTILNFPNQLGLCGLRPAADIARGNGYEQILELLEKAIRTWVQWIICNIVIVTTWLWVPHAVYWPVIDCGVEIIIYYKLGPMNCLWRELPYNYCLENHLLHRNRPAYYYGNYGHVNNFVLVYRSGLSVN